MAPTDEPTVPVFLLRGLVRAAERGGAAADAVLRGAALEPGLMERNDARLSLNEFERACQVAVRLTGDEAFGLHWAEPLLQSSFGPVAEGLSHAATLRKAFQLLARFEKFFTSVASHEVVEGPKEVSIRVRHSRLGRPCAMRMLLSELSLAWFIGVIRATCPDAEITRLECAYEAPSYTAEYARIFKLPVFFGRPHTQLTLPRFWLDARAAHLTSTGRGGEASASCAQAPTYGERLHQLFLEHAPNRVSMRRAARELGVHERSLRRYLAAEGRSFKEIEFSALAAFAKQLLLEDQQTVEQAASMMGFARVSAFQRAFKRWTGQSTRMACSRTLQRSAQS